MCLVILYTLLKINNFYKTKYIYEKFVSIYKNREFISDVNDPLYEDSESFKNFTKNLDYEICFVCPYFWDVSLNGDTGYISGSVMIKYYNEKYNEVYYETFPKYSKYIIKKIDNKWIIVDKDYSKYLG